MGKKRIQKLKKLKKQNNIRRNNVGSRYAPLTIKAPSSDIARLSNQAIDLETRVGSGWQPLEEDFDPEDNDIEWDDTIKPAV